MEKMHHMYSYIFNTTKIYKYNGLDVVINAG